MNTVDTVTKEIRKITEKERLRLLGTFTPFFVDVLLKMNIIDAYWCDEDEAIDWVMDIEYKGKKEWVAFERGMMASSIDELQKKELEFVHQVMEGIGLGYYFVDIKNEKMENIFIKSQQNHSNITIKQIEKHPFYPDFLIYTLENGEKLNVKIV